HKPRFELDKVKNLRSYPLATPREENRILRGFFASAFLLGQDPNVWTGGVLQGESLSAGDVGSCTNVSDLSVERFTMLLAIMDISAHSISLAGKPRTWAKGVASARLRW